MAKAIAITAVVFAIGFYIYFDPAKMAFAPKCTFKALTGYDCPGCGFQRALHALLNGHIGEAWAYNPFLFFILPVGAAYLTCEIWPERMPRLQKLLFSRASIIFLLISVITWWIARNL